MRPWPLLTGLCLLCACAAQGPRPDATPAAPAPVPPPASAETRALPEERHLKSLRQLTHGGENAEAYWSFDGQWLSLQARHEGQACDVIYRLRPFDAQPAPRQVSSGKGATTCAHYLPGGDGLIYASTHLGGDACPPKPDMSQGYVWALYESYDIFRANADGSGLVRLTETPGYDAEGTVCGKDGSVVFTSVRDGDLELYRMDRDGKNVKRLTFTPGYDGGAFFNADCTKLVWRASRPRPGRELDDYRALLAKGLVRPSKLELYVANADGSEPVQVTYLDAASFAPFFTPKGDRILFSSNYPEPRGREFDIWSIGVDGTGLERVTYAPGFDGFPMFSPDGKWLAFSSNRATAPGRNDTNLFLAEWKETAPSAEPRAADRLRADVTWLADPAREGRGVGTRGLDEAGAWLEQRFSQLGLRPSGDAEGYRQKFAVTTALERDAGTSLRLGEAVLAPEAFTPLAFSGQGKAKGPLVLAGYGIVEPEAGIDDYKGLSVKGRIVVVRRFAPEHPKLDTPQKQQRAGDLRKKAFLARERGAVGLLVVDWPASPAPRPKDWQLPAEAGFPKLTPEGTGDAGIPVGIVTRASLEKVWPTLEKRGRTGPVAELEVALRQTRSEAFNVAGVLPATGEKRLPPLLIGAHYDHLGLGGPGSLAPGRVAPHLGADDNASGVAVLLEVARLLAERKEPRSRDVVFLAFSGEESGVLGSSHFVSARPELVKAGAVMVNLDMVGRMRGNTVTALGAESAKEWRTLLDAACGAARVECSSSGDGYGPSDQMPFYAAGLPVLHFFTGAHGDYHKPSDAADKLNYGGAAQLASLVADLAARLQDNQLTYQKLSSAPVRGDVRSFGASLGTVPSYAGPPNGQKGVLIDDVRPGGGADKGGIRRGDILVKLGTNTIGSVEDLMFVLQNARPGETVTAVVLREGRELPLEVTFQEGRRR